MRYIASRIASANRSASSLHDDGRPAVFVPRAASSRWRSDDVVVIIFDVGDNDDARAPQPPPYNPSSHTERPRESALRGVDVGVRDATSVIRTTGFDSIRKQTRYTDSDRRPTRRRPPIPPLIYPRHPDFIPLRGTTASERKPTSVASACAGRNESMDGSIKSSKVSLWFPSSVHPNPKGFPLRSRSDDDESADGNQRGEDEENSAPVRAGDAGETGDARGAEKTDDAIRRRRAYSERRRTTRTIRILDV